MTAIEQLDYWLAYQKYWCEHKPSVTVSVKENEWMDVGAWVYENFDDVSGISFLPFSEHTYKQAPYQDINEEEYNNLMESMPSLLIGVSYRSLKKKILQVAVKNLLVLQVFVRSLTLRLVNGIVLIPILSYLFTLVFAGFVGSEALEGSMIEEYFVCVALLTIILF